MVSVPNGAGGANLQWLDRFVESHFDDKTEIILAMDTDRRGVELRDELVRRLGMDRCKVVAWGEGCKDANEHLVKYGAESLRICIEQAEEVPLEGIFTAEDCRDDLRSLYENGLQRGADTGWDNFDEHCTFEPRRLPGDDRTPRRRQVRIHRRAGAAPLPAPRVENRLLQPENMPIAYHLHKLAEKLTGHRFTPDRA